MGLFDFLKRKKKPQETAPEELIDIGGADLSGIEPPETRYTQEYRDFLAEREAAEAAGAAEGSDGGDE